MKAILATLSAALATAFVGCQTPQPTAVSTGLYRVTIEDTAVTFYRDPETREVTIIQTHTP